MQRKQSGHYLNVIATRHTTPAVVSQGPHALYLTRKRTPDVVVAILPEDNTKYLKIPVFVFEVIGSKEIRGKNERQFPGFVTTLQSLAFSPYAYYGEVDEDTVTLYHFQKKPEEGRIEITEESFTYVDYNPGAMAMAFGNIIEILTNIFISICPGSTMKPPG